MHLAALLLSLPNLGLHSTTSAPAALATSARDWYAGHVTTTRSLQSVKSARTCTSAKQENTHQRTEVRADFTDWGGGRRVRSESGHSIPFFNYCKHRKQYSFSRYRDGHIVTGNCRLQLDRSCDVCTSDSTTTTTSIIVRCNLQPERFVTTRVVRVRKAELRPRVQFVCRRPSKQVGKLERLYIRT